MKIAVLPGDGIGPEVMRACLTVLQSLVRDLRFEEGGIGLECHSRTGEYMPQETLALVKESDAVLFGAITTPKDRHYVSPLLLLRWELELYANVRPAYCLHPSVCVKPLDVVIVRENTEGLYTRIEREEAGKVITERSVSETACKRIIEFAFRYAVAHRRKKVTCVHKANVLRLSDGMFLNLFYGAAVNYAYRYKISSNDHHVDAAAMRLVKEPESLDVLVTLNMYGDILSDEAAGLVGGLGVAPSGNFGDRYALFEPVHGSAPEIAGKGIANPTGMILSAAMMLGHLGMGEEAGRVEKAVRQVITSGIRTPDIGGSASTMEFAAAVAAEVENPSTEPREE
ncbi:MAG: isocitrate/isopropylmalate dehydrogenase family protein [Candidatus Thermoplasmatota archaeon]